MRITIMIVISSLLLFCSNLFAEEMKSTIQIKGATPKGVIVKKNKIFIKKGYVLEKKSDTKVIARRNGGTGITGEFDCTCNGETGGCSAVTTPNSVTCVSSGCSSCYMIVTIPDPKTPVMHR